MTFDVAGYRKLIRGETQGWPATLARAGLSFLSAPYLLATKLRNWIYDSQFLRSHRVGLPVISIGNITAGGVGKTPFVELVARWLIDDQRMPVLISRGYGSPTGQNDEALLLAENLPGIPHLQNPDRVSAGVQARDKQLGDVIILDDGFQHRRIHRDLNLVLIDATDPFGQGWVLPRGLLRESLGALRRADAVVLTRADLVPDDEAQAIRKRVMEINPHILWSEVAFMPSRWRQWDHPGESLSAIAGKRVVAFCGIGNPEAFIAGLEKLGVNPVGSHIFSDHHAFSEADIDWLGKSAKDLRADAIVATQKDAVKIRNSQIGGLPFYWLAIEPVFRCGEQELRAIVRRCAGPPNQHANESVQQ